MRTIKNLIENGYAIRGLMAQIAGTNRVVEVGHIDHTNGVYLINGNGPYDASKLLLTAHQPNLGY